MFIYIQMVIFQSESQNPEDFMGFLVSGFEHYTSRFYDLYGRPLPNHSRNITQIPPMIWAEHIETVDTLDELLAVFRHYGGAALRLHATHRARA